MNAKSRDGLRAEILTAVDGFELAVREHAALDAQPVSTRDRAFEKRLERAARLELEARAVLLALVDEALAA